MARSQAAGHFKAAPQVTILSWNLLLDDLISNFIPRTMKDPPDELLKEIYKEGDPKKQWRDLKAKMNEEYKPWHQMKDLIKDPHDVSQKLRALWSQPDLKSLEGWDLGLEKEKVKDEVTLEKHLTCLGVLQKELKDKDLGRRVYDQIAEENIHRTWDRRMPKILNRITEEAPDLVAFQEYDMHRLQVEKKQFHEHMASAGYEGSPKGCVVLVHNSCVQAKKERGIFWKKEFSTPELRRQIASGVLESELWKASLAELADDTYGPAGTRVEVKECRDGMMQVTILHNDKDASIPQHHLKEKNQKELQDKLIGNLDLQERGEDGKLMKTMDRRSLGFVRLQIRGQPLLFCTTHLMTASRDLHGRVRTEELCTINSLMSELVNPHEAVIFCGDFNINSRGHSHDFIWKKKFLKGEKNVEKDRFVKAAETSSECSFFGAELVLVTEWGGDQVLQDFDSISQQKYKIRSKTIGEVQEIDTNGDALIKFECNADDPARLEWVSQKDFKHMRSLDHTGYEKDREERRFIWERSDGRELKMRDAYDDIYGSNDASSTITGMREETIDYVFFDEEMLSLQKKSALKCPGVMPNDQEPSDHIPLIVTFDLPDVEVQLKEGLRRLEHHLSNLLKEGKAGEKLAIDVLLPLMQAVEAARKQSLRTWLLTGSGHRPEAGTGECDHMRNQGSHRPGVLVLIPLLFMSEVWFGFVKGNLGCSQTFLSTEWLELFRQPSIVVGEDFSVPKNFDWQKSTKENYVHEIQGQVSGDSYASKYRAFRKLCDAEYHGLYNLDRQIWQDAQIDYLLKKGMKEENPWLLYTCGPMGVGKSFTLQWLNKEGYLNMQENMVKIDPDAIKERMPEYKGYDKKMAATHCHRESAYMMEIAQAAAMQKNFNVWVDGSLKDAEWYAQQFERIRSKYRDYHIAIFYIGADEQTILRRVQERAEGPDGRHVPPELVRASMASMDKTLNVLTPFCDFVARIKNNGPSPVLQAIDSIDHSGIWEGLRARMDTTQSMRSSVDFPQSLRPLSLTSVSSESLEFFRFDPSDKLKMLFDWKRSTVKMPPSELRCSPLRKVRLPGTKEGTDDATRKALGIDALAQECCWIYPLKLGSNTPAELVETFRHLKQDQNPVAFVLENGGFCYLNEELKIVALIAIVPVGRAKMQFKRREVKGRSPDATSEVIPFEPDDIGYWHEVTLEFLKKRGAEEFAYLAPHEMSSKTGVEVGGEYGSFAYKFKQRDKQEVVVFDFIGAGTL
ncbi:unnamed protein product [Symbiodinium sp. CCMP2592]|nr:unnamed protein product [Symbiodinium sp. CCMP2592]